MEQLFCGHTKNLVLLPFFVLLFATAAKADLRKYVADLHESAWIVSASAVRCELRHDVPLYGTARFFQEAGSELSFRLTVDYGPTQNGAAQLSSAKPSWWHHRRGRELEEVVVTRQTHPIAFNRQKALRLLMELETGLHPTFRYPDWVDGRDHVEVTLSAVRFLDSFTRFRQCLSQLLPFGFEAVRVTRVQFETDQDDLSAEAQRKLERVARYAAASEQIQTVLIRGHADWIATKRYNLGLSKRRAASVKAYLVAQGVKESLIGERWFGESEPLQSNLTAAGRAANRRVAVELIR